MFSGWSLTEKRWQDGIRKWKCSYTRYSVYWMMWIEDEDEVVASPHNLTSWFMFCFCCPLWTKEKNQKKCPFTVPESWNQNWSRSGLRHLDTSRDSPQNILSLIFSPVWDKTLPLSSTTPGGHLTVWYVLERRLPEENCCYLCHFK